MRGLHGSRSATDAGDVVRNPIGTELQLGTAENDVRRAVAFVKQRAPEYHVNPNRIVLIGESAVRQLASMAALRPDPEGAVQGVVAFCTPSDLASLARTCDIIHDNLSSRSRRISLSRLRIHRINRASRRDELFCRSDSYSALAGKAF
jgi:acetyl esterase/lipase